MLFENKNSKLFLFAVIYIITSLSVIFILEKYVFFLLYENVDSTKRKPYLPTSIK